MTRRDGRLLFFLILLPASLLLSPLFLGRTHFIGDVMWSFQPWLTMAAQEVQAGRFPLWNPYSACGEPLFANPQLMTLFPPATLFSLFPFAAGWRLFFLLAEALLTLSLYLLFRRSGRAGAALGAAAAAWSGFTLAHWEFPGALATLPFAVFFIFLAARRAMVFLLPAAALVFLAGYTQFAYYAALVGGAFAAAGAWGDRKKFPPAKGLLRAAAWAAAGLLVAAPQILLSWEVVRQSIRTDMSEADASSHLLTPIFLIKFLIPEIYDKTISAFRPALFDARLWPMLWNWLRTFYLGVAVLPLACLGTTRRNPSKTWIIAGLAGLAMAMGVEPLFSLLRLGVPGMRYMTHFSNAILVTLIALSALAAEGLRAGETRRRPAFAALVIGALVAAAHFLSPGLRDWTLGRLLDVTSLTATQHQGVARAAGQAALLCAAAAPLFLLKRGRAAALLLFTIFDLWLFGRDMQPTVPGDFFQKPVPLANMVRDDARFAIDPLLVRDGGRPLEGDTHDVGYQSLRQTLFLNAQAPFRVHQAWAYEVFPNRRFTEVRHVIDLENPFGPIMDFLGCRHIMAIRRLPPPAVYKAHRPNAILYGNPGALPRVTWTPSARVLSNDAERLAFMAGPWDPRREVLLEAPPPEEKGARLDDLRWMDAPGRLKAEGRSGGGWLVWSQVFYPGWEAYVNGRRERLWRANHAFQAVELPAGNWRVKVIYRPPLLPWGLGAAVMVLTALAAAFLRGVGRAGSRLSSWPPTAPGARGPSPARGA